MLNEISHSWKWIFYNSNYIFKGLKIGVGGEVLLNTHKSPISESESS
jgi:hypothetical protein